MSNRANLANGITATAISASSNTVALEPGYAARMPPVPFFATITPFGQLPTMGNSEIVQVTSASGNNLSVVRSQKGTVAKSFPAGSVFTNSVYADDKITADNIDFTTMPGNKYTTTEMDTGKKWVNGKSIYRKSIIFNTTGSGAEETGANNENFSYIDTLISLDAILNMPNGERYPNSYTNPSAPSLQYFQLKFANWNNAQVLRYQTRSVGTVTMTILYTKK